MLRGKDLLQSELEEMKLSLDNEVERQTRLQSKHQVEMNHLKTNLEAFKTVNVKLKQVVFIIRYNYYFYYYINGSR